MFNLWGHDGNYCSIMLHQVFPSVLFDQVLEQSQQNWPVVPAGCQLCRPRPNHHCRPYQHSLVWWFRTMQGKTQFGHSLNWRIWFGQISNVWQKEIWHNWINHFSLTGRSMDVRFTQGDTGQPVEGLTSRPHSCREVACPFKQHITTKSWVERQSHARRTGRKGNGGEDEIKGGVNWIVLSRQYKLRN